MNDGQLRRPVATLRVEQLYRHQNLVICDDGSVWCAVCDTHTGIVIDWLEHEPIPGTAADVARERERQSMQEAA